MHLHSIKKLHDSLRDMGKQNVNAGGIFRLKYHQFFRITRTAATAMTAMTTPMTGRGKDCSVSAGVPVGVPVMVPAGVEVVPDEEASILLLHRQKGAHPLPLHNCTGRPSGVPHPQWC